LHKITASPLGRREAAAQRAQCRSCSSSIVKLRADTPTPGFVQKRHAKGDIAGGQATVPEQYGFIGAAARLPVMAASISSLLRLSASTAAAVFPVLQL